MQSKVARSLDFCNRYEANFQIPVGGAHWLKVVRLRKDYTAVRYINKFPRLNYEIFVDEMIGQDLDALTPNLCTTDTPQESGYWVTNQSRIVDQKMYIKDSCSHLGENRGIKLWTNINLSSKSAVLGCSNQNENYNWNRKICTDKSHYKSDLYGESGI